MKNKLNKIEDFFMEKIILFPYSLVMDNKSKSLRQIALISTVLWIMVVGILYVPFILIFTIKGLLDIA